MSVTVSHFLSSLIPTGKARSLLLQWSLLAFPTNIRLGWKCLTLANALAFLGSTIKWLECGVATGVAS